METYNFAAVSPKCEVLAEYTGQPVIPRKGDMLVINNYPYKIARWVYDRATDHCGFAVMVERDLDFAPYTVDEVRRRMESGETFYFEREDPYLHRIKRMEDGKLVHQAFNLDEGKVKTFPDEGLDYTLGVFIQRRGYGAAFSSDVICDGMFHIAEYEERLIRE